MNVCRKMSVLTVVALGLGACSDLAETKVQPLLEANNDNYTLVWNDEFDGNAIDETRWQYRLDCKHWSKQQQSNNVVADGYYTILLKKERVECPNNTWLQPGQKEGDEPARVVHYTGGGVISKSLFRYGFYEARLKTPVGAGWHSSFWMMKYLEKPENSDSLKFNPLDDPSLHSHIELDPFENDSIDPTHFQTDAHQWKPEPGTEDKGRKQNKVGTKQIRFNDGTTLTEFHVYGMEFTKTHVRYYFDGKLVSETEFPASRYKHNDVNIWLTGLGTFLGNTQAIDDSKLPEQITVDYVRFFKKNN
ncbi:kappa-carrageenase [precursor] [Alteromonas sp. KUL17]|uniref:glycoside hydrolase family 16 protein n=1 Tax=Alteromonas sp. KUL17 TaxID=2480796 RepID=UPI001037A9C2|nr:family 16 glycosylhydrolase [Alteromonas sp. KUL17]TAP29821.1 glycosyl hydrolase family protein [Alteromonas sp. KUL17]GEA02222.1 kappa-carrageenase [precursor] [Alteromonas sp. KUL17]